MASSLFGSLFRRVPTAPATKIHFPYTAETNPYQCKRTWPPDFTKLSHKHQFRLERRYRRRAKLKWARPTWTKAVKLTQWGAILFTVGYGLFFMEVDEKLWPVVQLRRWYQEQVQSLSGAREYKESTKSSPESTVQKG